VVADQALPETAEIQKPIPVRAIAGQSCDIVGEDDPCLPQGDSADEFLEPCAPFGRAARDANIGIDDLNALSRPSAVDGSLLQSILQAQALPVAEGLLRR
jgi:hypothetical protein